MKYSDLLKHPEGGRYLEVYRSMSQVSIDDKTRTALTHIYFSLEPHEVSRFHRVSNDEVWNLYQGEGLYLYQWDGSSSTIESIELSAKLMNFCHVIPAGYWQAAVPIKDRVLVGCSVAPGFEFEDFELIVPESDIAQTLLKIDPGLSKLIQVR
ncbi:cupin domain-containing protein [Leptothoe spongobia]|uniref:Cupin domain-containing protein n=1 Tax=Leptothoe spongobia TAU-MAC 1115 TaxID=1967444 RepID=A0A947GLG0_9CYAN|nr:cupin domain-containing protein [Leptothoe spongobia]MBT9317172.1 cupin domain-containing protein [Leptothoe spongobia TAU-MAC 1115]